MNIKLKKEKIKQILEIIILIMIDQAIKFFVFLNKQELPINFINNILNLNYVENFGIAFGMAKGGLIVTGTIGIAGRIILEIIKEGKKNN